MFFIFYFANKNIPNLESFINDHISLDKPTTIVVFHELGDEDFRLHVNVEDHSIIVFFFQIVFLRNWVNILGRRDHPLRKASESSEVFGGSLGLGTPERLT